MSRKDKHLNQLRKAHIWPSIVFLLLTILCAVLCLTIMVAMMLNNKLDERLKSACIRGYAINSAFMDPQADCDEIIQKLLENGTLTDQFCILSPEGEVVADLNNPNVSLILKYPAESLDNDEIPVSLRPDITLNNNIMHSDGTMHPEEITSNNKLLDMTLVDPKTPMSEARFWVQNELPDGRLVLCRCTATIYAKDLINAWLLGLFGFGMMMLPVLFLFSNIILNFQNQKRMTRLLYTNTVTGGHNALYYEHTANRMLNARLNKLRHFMVVDMTLMKYRSYCTYHGIHAGEELLERVERSLQKYLNKNEFCALFGKSTFVLFLFCDDKESGKKRVEDMVTNLSINFGHGGIVFHAGIYFTDSYRRMKLANQNPMNPSDMLNCAGAARISLEDENVPGAAVYVDDLLEQQRWTHKVEEKMEGALRNEEFQVYIQPKYTPVTEELAGGEALVRWINEEDGFIPPGRFIPIFEKNRFITKLDDYMISHVAALQAMWLREGKTVVPISVNVSRAHFANPDLAEHICRLVDQYDVPHHLIEIELTESAFFDDKAMLLRTVHELNRMGFEISMDDFGAGYSSLNSLKDLPLDVLKLDADFFRGDNAENRGEIVVSQAIALAKKLDMRIVAEGVEKKEQVDFLAEQGCDMIQGYYFAKPMPAEEYAQRLRQDPAAVPQSAVDIASEEQQLLAEMA